MNLYLKHRETTREEAARIAADLMSENREETAQAAECDESPRGNDARAVEIEWLAREFDLDLAELE